jgi:hypothetical protein
MFVNVKKRKAGGDSSMEKMSTRSQKKKQKYNAGRGEHEAKPVSFTLTSHQTGVIYNHQPFPLNYVEMYC